MVSVVVLHLMIVVDVRFVVVAVVVTVIVDAVVEDLFELVRLYLLLQEA